MKTTCLKCNYQWDYKGDKANATCPNCQRKVNVQGSSLVFHSAGSQININRIRSRLNRLAANTPGQSELIEAVTEFLKDTEIDQSKRLEIDAEAASFIRWKIAEARLRSGN